MSASRYRRVWLWTLAVLLCGGGTVGWAQEPSGTPNDLELATVVAGKDSARELERKLGSKPCIAQPSFGEPAISYLYSFRGVGGDYFLRFQVREGREDAISAATMSKEPPLPPRNEVCYAPLEITAPVRTGKGLQLGSTRDDVIRLYGEPAGKSAEGQNERLEYQVQPQPDVRYIWDLVFQNGHLVEWTILVMDNRPMPGAKANGGVKKMAPPAPIPRRPPPPTAEAIPPEKEGDFAVVRVFYATDRKVASKTESAKYYGNERGILELGICEVSIPRDHRMAHLESPSIWKLEFREDPSKHVVLLKVQPQPAEELFLNLRDQVSRSQQKQAFVFVHGYNVTFEDAARRTAQIAYDLRFDGAPILYSWPSQGTLVGYTADETTVEWTVPHLKDFLTMIVTKSGAQVIHLIAHSMGNRALTAALRQIVNERQGAVPFPKFKEIVLTAPDIDTGVFMELAQEIQKAGERVTLYASSKDEALIVSQRFHGGFPRAGESGPAIVIAPGIDTIDASAVDTGLLGHSYFGDTKSVLFDLFNLFRDGNPPANRFGISQVEQNTKKYWMFKP